MELHEIIAIIVVGIAFILFGIVVRISYRHHKAINKLNSTISSLGSTERIAINVRDINLSVRIIAYIALAFCLGVVIHYLAIALPRIYETKKNAEELQNFGVDYLGLIVAIFAIIVTLLVGWQIFSNIQERNRIERFARDNEVFYQEMIKFRDGLEERFKELEKCCDGGKSELKRLDKKIDNTNNASLLVMSANSLMKASNFEDKDSKTNHLLISMAYSSLWQAAYQYISSKVDKRNILGCISQMKTCLMMLSIDELKLIKEQYYSSLEKYALIKVLSEDYKDAEIMSALDEIKELQEKMGWDKEWEERRVAFEEFEKERDRLEAEEAAKKEPPTDEKNSANPDSPTSE